MYSQLTASQQKFCNDFVSTDGNVHTKVCKVLLDMLSSRGNGFEVYSFVHSGIGAFNLGFSLTQSRKSRTKAEEVILDKQELLCYDKDNNLDFSHLRLSRISDPYIPGLETKSNARTIEIFDGTVLLFSHESAARACHEFLEYLFGTERFHTSTSTPTAGTTIVLNRFNVFIATKLLCYQNYDTIKVKDRSQKLKYNKFVAHLLYAYIQFIGNVRSSLRNWCPKDLAHSALFVSGSVTYRSKCVQDEATNRI